MYISLEIYCYSRPGYTNYLLSGNLGSGRIAVQPSGSDCRFPPAWAIIIIVDSVSVRQTLDAVNRLRFSYFPFSLFFLSLYITVIVNSNVHGAIHGLCLSGSLAQTLCIIVVGYFLLVLVLNKVFFFFFFFSFQYWSYNNKNNNNGYHCSAVWSWGSFVRWWLAHMCSADCTTWSSIFCAVSMRLHCGCSLTTSVSTRQRHSLCAALFHVGCHKSVACQSRSVANKSSRWSQSAILV